MSVAVALAIVLAALTVAWIALEVLFARWIAELEAERAAIVADRVEADRRAARNMPPGVSLTEAYELAAELGIPVAEAAGRILNRRGNARLRAALEHHLDPR